MALSIGGVTDGSLDLLLSAAAMGTVSDPSESIPGGGVATKPALTEWKTIMETR